MDETRDPRPAQGAPDAADPAAPAAKAQKSAKEKPHYHGHRQRMRERVLTHGADSLADYELLENLLFGARPNGDMKPVAKRLLKHFGSIGAVLTASPERLREVQGVGTAAIHMLKITQDAGRRMAREETMNRHVISSWDRLVSYCRTQVAHETIEQFHLLFLDKKQQLIADEAQGRGTVDHTPVYPREVVKRALTLDASAIILVHNHPSGDTTPSKADVAMTRQIIDAARPMGIQVHDHLIITKRGYTSFKKRGLM